MQGTPFVVKGWASNLKRTQGLMKWGFDGTFSSWRHVSYGWWCHINNLLLFHSLELEIGSTTVSLFRFPEAKFDEWMDSLFFSKAFPNVMIDKGDWNVWEGESERIQIKELWFNGLHFLDNLNDTRVRLWVKKWIEDDIGIEAWRTSQRERSMWNAFTLHPIPNAPESANKTTKKSISSDYFGQSVFLGWKLV